MGDHGAPLRLASFSFHFHSDIPQVLLNGSMILFVKAQNVYVVPPCQALNSSSLILECVSAIDSCPSCMMRFCLIVLCFVVLTSSLSRTMGKKSRVKTQKSGTGASTVVSPKEMMNLISELLQSMFMLHLFLVGTVGINFCYVPYEGWSKPQK